METKKNQAIQRISVALLLALSACSDQTQFTEKTISSNFTDEKNLGESASQAAAQEPMGYSDDLIAEEEAPSDLDGELPDAGGQPEAPDTTQNESDKSSENAGQNQGGVMQPRKQESLFQLCADQPNHPIVADVYPLAVNTQNLPDFASLQPVGEEVCLPQLNISERAFSEGFPGVDELIEWFGLDLRFKVNVPTSGSYTLTLSSDDGSLLFIDDKSVINNDGLHQTRERSATVYLTAGQHSFHVKYFQGPRYHIALELFWKVPGATTRTYIPQNLLSRP